MTNGNLLKIPSKWEQGQNYLDAVMKRIRRIAIGAMIFSFLYWGFGFLRMGTTGLIAQAIGAGDLIEIKASLYRASLLALAIGLFLVLLQWPISTFAFSIIDRPRSQSTP